MIDSIILLVVLTVLGFNSICPSFAENGSDKMNAGQNSEVNNQNSFGSQSITDAIEIPPPPAIALPDPGPCADGAPATCLAWRSHALALANEYPLKKNSVAWILPVNYSKGQNLLKKAISELGLQLLAQYAEAGQFLIASLPEANNKSEIIVISQPINETSTLFKMRVYDNGRNIDNKKANSLPETMKNLLTDQGLWQ